MFIGRRGFDSGHCCSGNCKTWLEAQLTSLSDCVPTRMWDSRLCWVMHLHLFCWSVFDVGESLCLPGKVLNNTLVVDKTTMYQIRWCNFYGHLLTRNNLEWSVKGTQLVQNMLLLAKYPKNHISHSIKLNTTLFRDPVKSMFHCSAIEAFHSRIRYSTFTSWHQHAEKCSYQFNFFEYVCISSNLYKRNESRLFLKTILLWFHMTTPSRLLIVMRFPQNNQHAFPAFSHHRNWNILSQNSKKKLAEEILSKSCRLDMQLLLKRVQ